MQTNLHKLRQSGTMLRNCTLTNITNDAFVVFCVTRKVKIFVAPMLFSFCKSRICSLFLSTHEYHHDTVFSTNETCE